MNPLFRSSECIYIFPMRVKVAEQMVLMVSFNWMRNNALRIYDDELRDYLLKFMSFISICDVAKNLFWILLENYLENSRDCSEEIKEYQLEIMSKVLDELI